LDLTVVVAAGDRRGSAAKLLVGQSTSAVDLSLVGAALAAKLLIAPIPLVDKCTLAGQ